MTNNDYRMKMFRFIADTNSSQYAGCFRTTYTNGYFEQAYMNVKPSSQPGAIDGCITARGKHNYTFAGGEVR